MKNYVNELVRRHRRLNRLIDNCRAAGRQQEMQQLKRIRLQIKDKIAAAKRELAPVTT
ncbi:YdcH family protein [Parasphingorhabdus cellanae]|uniref:YdcH family protein n=1 Tax=Parasphingorhabdus cellanae TaxID=2806553 RepID=A0ABX7T3M3_9SPHN|nr:YdcH family protein [Parasphingorhabdus cellanae]QTD55415.1 YdcH family protein [Parasphingorhabdus cellanae]